MDVLITVGRIVAVCALFYLAYRVVKANWSTWTKKSEEKKPEDTKKAD